MRGAIAVGTALLLLVAGGGALAASPSPAPAPGPAQAPPAPPENYRLGVGDQIEINIFGEPDLSRTVSIKPDGLIALPLVDQVKAQGKTVAQLEADLTRLYGKYLRRPSVSVIVRQFRMDHVYVMGEVSKPGRYDMSEDMTVLDALTAAGGPTDKSNLDGIQLSRVENGKSKSIPVKMNQVVQGKGTAQNLKMQNGDLLYIPRRGMNFLEILQTILQLRWAVGF